MAQTYPSRPVRLIVTSAAGGSPDIIARLIGQWLSERLGQPVIVDNRTGAGGNIGTEIGVRAPPDGYTLLMALSSNAINAAVYEKLPFNFIRDTAPVASIASIPLIMEVNPSVPVKTVPEFIAYAKANPGKINMGSSGTANLSHLAAELFRMQTGIEWVHVPFRGTPATHAALIAGEIQVMFDAIGSALPHIQSGALRALGVSAKTRMRVLPNIPPIGDFVPGYEVTGWLGYGAPKGTPAEIVEKLNREVNAVLAEPAINARLLELGSIPLSGSAADFGKLIADETEKWGKVVKFAGLRAD
jgi:tripartite-type tricarboxylate transporter receptor subunit TctC